MNDANDTPSWAECATHDERRSAILRSVGKILRRRDISKITMQSIAEEIGLTKGNLYYYYKNKHDMLFDCHVRASEEILKLLSQARAAKGPPSAELGFIIDGLVRSVIEDPYGAILVADFGNLSAEQRRRYVAVRDQYEHRVRELIAEGVACGEFAATDEKIAGFAILGAVNWVSRWYDPAGPRRPDEIARQFADFLVRGLRP